jgi:formiminotetrahydrofolate cyclodeaminase
MRYALEVLTLTEVLAEKGNPNAITDTGCAVHLAQTAIEGAALNVNINLSSLNDEAFIDRVREEVETIRKRAQESSQRVLTIIESTIS